MIVTTITYKRLINAGSYENFSVEMTAQITAEDPVPPAFDELRDEVNAACKAEIERRDLWRGQWPDLFPRQKAEASDAAD